MYYYRNLLTLVGFVQFANFIGCAPILAKRALTTRGLAYQQPSKLQQDKGITGRFQYGEKMGIKIVPRKDSPNYNELSPLFESGLFLAAYESPWVMRPELALPALDQSQLEKWREYLLKVSDTMDCDFFLAGIWDLEFKQVRLVYGNDTIGLDRVLTLLKPSTDGSMRARFGKELLYRSSSRDFNDPIIHPFADFTGSDYVLELTSEQLTHEERISHYASRPPPASIPEPSSRTSESPDHSILHSNQSEPPSPISDSSTPVSESGTSGPPSPTSKWARFPGNWYACYPPLDLFPPERDTGGIKMWIDYTKDGLKKEFIERYQCVYVDLVRVHALNKS